jgi:hypothetical protein
LGEIRCVPRQSYCVRYVGRKCIVVCSSIRDHDATIFGNRTKNTKMITYCTEDYTQLLIKCVEMWGVKQWADVSNSEQFKTALSQPTLCTGDVRKQLLWMLWCSPSDELSYVKNGSACGFITRLLYIGQN